jgi:hypothetical protein
MSPRTTLEKKIEQLEADLKIAKARKATVARQVRTRELISFGLLLERYYRSLSSAEKEKVRGYMDGMDARTKARAEEGFMRLDSALIENSFMV